MSQPMSKDLVLYTNPRSRGAIAVWMLEEVGAPYRLETVEFGPAMKTADYRAINPMGKVPALLHGDTVVTETAAICAYLADAFPEAGLAPPLSDRGAYYRWLFFGAGCTEPAVTNKAAGFTPTKEQEPMFGYGSYDLVMDTLAAHLKGRKYIVGDKFTAADVYIGSHVGWGMQFGTMPRRPEFEAYWDGLKDRPAHRRSEEHVEKI